MRILYLGDIMGQPGRRVVATQLPNIKTKHNIDFVIAQAENTTHGKSISPMHMRQLQQAGVDFFSGGNHTLERPAILPLLANPDEPIIAPLNQQGVAPGWGAKRVVTSHGVVLITSLLGDVYPRPVPMSNPLQAIDELLASKISKDVAAIVVNFHGDLSSEKRVIGYYLDGRVTAVIGDHWHVPTADAMVLPGGTAHITDVGMCGTLHSSLGVHKEVIISRWRDGTKQKNTIADHPPYQLNGVIINTNPQSIKASTIQPLQIILEKLE